MQVSNKAVTWGPRQGWAIGTAQKKPQLETPDVLDICVTSARSCEWNKVCGGVLKLEDAIIAFLKTTCLGRMSIRQGHQVLAVDNPHILMSGKPGGPNYVSPKRLEVKDLSCHSLA